MTLNNARRAVKRVIVTCGGRPRNHRLEAAFDALEAEAASRRSPAQDLLDDFDISNMEDYFLPPFTQASSIADEIYELVAKEKCPERPLVPSLETTTSYFTLYLISGGIVQ